MDVPSIIRALGGPSKIGAHIGVLPNTVAYWAHRQSVPARWWLALTQIPGAAHAGVTLKALSLTAAAPQPAPGEKQPERVSA